VGSTDDRDAYARSEQGTVFLRVGAVWIVRWRSIEACGGAFYPSSC